MDMDVDRLPPNNLNLASSLSPSTHHRHPVRIRLTASLFLDLGESSFSLGEWVLTWAFSPAFSDIPPAAMDAPPPPDGFLWVGAGRAAADQGALADWMRANVPWPSRDIQGQDLSSAFC